MEISKEQLDTLISSLQTIDNCSFFCEGIVQCITSLEEYDEMMKFIQSNKDKQLASNIYLEKAMDIYYGKDVWREWLSE